MKKQISCKIVSLIFAVLVVCFAIAFYAVAWVEPSGDSPIGNVPAPLNTSNIEQIKVGGLILNTGGAVVGFAVDQGRVGIGTLTPSAKLDIFTNPASTNTVEEMLRLTRETQGVAAAGMGESIDFYLENNVGAIKETARISNEWTGTASLDAPLIFYVMSGGTLYESMRLIGYSGISARGAYLSKALNVGPIGTGLDNTFVVRTPEVAFPVGGVGIGTNNPESRLQVDGGYLQIDVVSAVPPVADCNEVKEQGRMILYTVFGGDMLYICGSSGWIAK